VLHSIVLYCIVFIGLNFLSDFRPRNRNLHLRGDGHAAVRRGLLQERLREVGLRHAEMELHRFLSQVSFDLNYTQSIRFLSMNYELLSEI
jgi:hypothetical protein